MRLERALLMGTVATLLSLALLIPSVAQNNLTPRTSSTRAFADGDWPRYTGDFAGTRFSRLKEINTTNVSKLTSAWTFAGVGGQQ
ncbi:MAG TPA: hypothetical protein VFE29_09375, partial [Terriglobia bacterium]|nr:hypothetical protein [Terriglobia bacterium]